MLVKNFKNKLFKYKINQKIISIVFKLKKIIN